MAARLEFDVGFGLARRRREESVPMRLLVLGDFSGTPVSERPPLASRRTLRVDVDSLDDVIGRLRPKLSLSAGEITFARIADFHPDQLAARLEVFKALGEKRTHPRASNEDLERLLGKALAVSSPPTTAPPANALDAFIHNIIAPHIVRDTSIETRTYLAGIDAAFADEMRALLHVPAFQSLEAAWRGAHWLISSLELDENLQLHLFDIAREELFADIVEAQGRVSETGLYHALVDRWRNVPGGEGWSAIAALIDFGPSEADIGVLAALGVIASRAGGPLLGGADRALAGEEGEALAAWDALRRSEAAPWIALGTPRVLLRRPYGKRSDPIEAFPFDEFVGAPVQEELLWGNAALALALLIGRAFIARGWDMEPGDEREIDDLPAYTFVRNGQTEMQPCGERSLTEREVTQLLSAGLVPLASRRDRHAVVAIRFQSIAAPPAPLAW
jgi:type VI secretion system ImpC/EvpB family protein